MLKALLISGTVSSMTITLLLLFRDYQTIDKEESDIRRGYQWVPNAGQHSNRYLSSDRQYYPRVKLMSSINTVLRELISLSNLIGSIREHHYLTQTSGISLAILWISNHFDNGVELLYTSRLFISSHVLQFFLILISLWFAYLIRDDKPNQSHQKNVRQTVKEVMTDTSVNQNSFLESMVWLINDAINHNWLSKRISLVIFY